MFKNYILLAVRNSLKKKGFSLINIVGLSLGMAVCITILLFVHYEKNFDGMHAKNIYRLDEVQSPEGMTAPQKVALSMYPMGPSLQADFPEVKNYTRIAPFEMAGLAYKEKKVFLENVFWTDASFFDIFDFKLLHGNKKTALKNENCVVLTKESAEKLFGKENPMGKSLTTHNMRDTLHFTVTGIMENIPENSHLQFAGLYSLITVAKPDGDANNWNGNWLVTYLELAENTDIKKLEKKFPAFLQKYTGEESIKSLSLFLQSLKDVHGSSSEITHDYHNYQKFDTSYTNLFSIIAFIVLLIACINFINLSTAQSAGRAKEVGVRKSVGAHRPQLILQFLSESLLLSFISMILAVILVKLFLPYINSLSEHVLEFSIITSPLLFLQVLAGTCIIGFLSGIYPAFYLSSFNPSRIFKGASLPGKNRSFMRNALVVGQFASAAFLIIATIFVIKQLNFMRQKDIGFNKEEVLLISGAFKNYTKLKTALEKNPLVKGVTGSAQSLGNNFHQSGFTFKGSGPARSLASSQVTVDDNFIPLYELKLLAGKNFSGEGNARQYIVNESLAKELLKDEPVKSYESLIGKNFGWGEDTTSSIVAVVKDFNFNSLHTKIETLCLIYFNTRGFHDVSVKIDGRKTKEAIDFIGSTYREIIPNYPFAYQFLDEHFEKLYRSDEKVSKVVSMLGALAVFIACLGLLGLASYSAEKRVKEIGVRKVLGASVPNIISLLSKDFLKLVLLANLLAWPLAWFAANAWLRDYPYHIEISLWVFVIAGVSSLCIALFAVSSQTFRAAVANPVKSLRTE